MLARTDLAINIADVLRLHCRVIDVVVAAGVQFAISEGKH